jgi:hypothetical protein
VIEQLDETLARLEPRFPPALIPAEALARVRSIARALPATPSFSFECRLGEQQERVDFLTAVSPAWGGEELATPGFTATGPLAGPAWERIAAFCTEWTDGSGLLGRVPFFWLEFDIPGPLAGIPPPFPTVCVQPGFRQGRLIDSSGSTPDEIRRIAWRSLELMRGAPLPPVVERSVAACFERLPPSSCVVHVAPFSARGSDSVRLVLRIPKRAVPDYLGRIGWMGEPSELEERVMGLLDYSGMVDVYLDVGERVLPPVGMGYTVPDSPGDPRARLLVDRLVEAGLCTPAKREGLLQWLGREHAVLPGARWPSQVLRTASIKLVHRAGQPVEAKGYVEFEARFTLVE